MKPTPGNSQKKEQCRQIRPDKQKPKAVLVAAAAAAVVVMTATEAAD